MSVIMVQSKFKAEGVADVVPEAPGNRRAVAGRAGRRPALDGYWLVPVVLRQSGTAVRRPQANRAYGGAGRLQ